MDQLVILSRLSGNDSGDAHRDKRYVGLSFSSQIERILNTISPIRKYLQKSKKLFGICNIKNNRNT